MPRGAWLSTKAIKVLEAMFDASGKIARLEPDGGTAIAAADVALHANWGANAAATVASGSNDARGTLIVTTNAADTPGASPTITLTFKDGTWGNAPFAVVCMENSSTGPVTNTVTCATTATTLVIKYNGTPTATSALTYKFNYVVLG